MKTLKWTVLYVLFLVLASCKGGTETHEHEHMHEHMGDSAHHDHTTAEAGDNSGLTLDNGKKWQTDAPTRAAFANMNGIVKDFSAKTAKPALADYNNLGKSMQKELDKLFKECRMEGQAHEQLHTLLEHIIGDVKMLKGSDEKAAANAYTALPGHLNLFDKYFQ